MKSRGFILLSANGDFVETLLVVQLGASQMIAPKFLVLIIRLTMAASIYLMTLHATEHLPCYHWWLFDAEADRSVQRHCRSGLYLPGHERLSDQTELLSGDLHQRLTIWCLEMKVNSLRFALGSRAWVNSHPVYRHLRSSPTRLHLHRDDFCFWLLQVDLG